MNSEAVQNAINRRGGGAPTPQLASVSPGMPMPSGALPNPIPQSAMDKSSAMPSQPKAPSQKFQPSNQQDMLVMALTEQMKSNSKLESEKLKTINGQSTQPPIPQVPQFNSPAPQDAGNVFGSPSTMSTGSMQGSPFANSPF